MKGRPKTNFESRHGRSHRFLWSRMSDARDMIKGVRVCGDPSLQEWQKGLGISSIIYR